MITKIQSSQILELVRQQAQIIRSAYNSRYMLSIEYKSDGMDFVTETDKIVEKSLIQGISQIFPNAVFWGEESGKNFQNEENVLLFVIDPIDGTKYFRHGMSLVTISIGVQYNGQNIWGLIYNPFTDDFICGGKENGVHNQFGEIFPPKIASLSETQVYFDSVGMKKCDAETQNKGLEFMGKIFQASYRARTAGASCLFAFGATSGLFGAILDVFGGVKTTDRIGYSAILQGLNWEERKVMIGNAENFWLGPKHILDELESLL